MTEDEKQNRTAVDVLLDIEAKIDNLTSLLKNHDLLLKILAQKQNMNSSSVVPPVEFKEPQMELEQPIKKVTMPGLKEGVVLNIKPKINLEEPKPVVVSNNRNVIPVSQLIMKDNEPIIMADVELYSKGDNNDLVLLKKIKTSQAGKWTASLSPGNYFLTISKKGIGKKAPFFCEKNFTIDESDMPIVLENISI